MNFIIRRVLIALTDQGHYRSRDRREVMLLYRLVLSQFFNSALVSLLAYGRPPHGATIPRIFRPFHVLTGPFDDMDRAWFTAVGVQAQQTFLLLAVTELGEPWVRFLLWRRRMLKEAALTEKTGGFGSCSNQRELNDILVAPPLDLTTENARVLNLLLFVLCFGPGCPLLVSDGHAWLVLPHHSPACPLCYSHHLDI